MYEAKMGDVAHRQSTCNTIGHFSITAKMTLGLKCPFYLAWN
jgi:hypothetical protein